MLLFAMFRLYCVASLLPLELLWNELELVWFLSHLHLLMVFLKIAHLVIVMAASLCSCWSMWFPDTVSQEATK